MQQIFDLRTKNDNVYHMYTVLEILILLKSDISGLMLKTIEIIKEKIENERK